MGVDELLPCLGHSPELQQGVGVQMRHGLENLLADVRHLSAVDDEGKLGSHLDLRAEADSERSLSGSVKIRIGFNVCSTIEINSIKRKKSH